MTLTLDIATDLEHQILQEARRRGLDVKSFVLNLLRESLASKTAPGRRLTEAELLEEINRGLPPQIWSRYRELLDKRQDESLTDDEHDELIELIDSIEIANAHRIECLAELASRRQVSLESLMAEMGIRPSAHG